MKKKTWKTIAALTLTAGLMIQPVTAAYAAEGEWAVEEAGEVITEDVWSEDYGAADETDYAGGTEDDIQEEVFEESEDVLYSEDQSAADPFGMDEGYVTEDAGLPEELWTDIPQNADSAADTVLFDEEMVTEDTVSEDTAGADEPANTDRKAPGSDEAAGESLITEELLSGTDELIGEGGQNLLAAADAAAADPSVVIEEELSLEEKAGIDGAADNSGELFEKLAEIEFYGSVLEEEKGDSAGEAINFASADPDFAAVNYLSGINLELYNANVTELKKISSGSRESAVIEITDASLGKEEMTATAEELGVPILTVKDGTTVITDEAKKALTAKYSDRYAYSAQTLLNAFLADLPYDLYWFNKASGQGGMKLQRMGSYKATKSQLTLTNARYVFSYTVSTEYARNGETYVVDQTDRQVLDKAVANAKAIVDKCASYKDFSKLDQYRKEICNLVYYQMPLDTAYGNAWQLIWVFDGDPSTNVVCEGYAKAFSYLAQLSRFTSSRVEVKTVSGYISKDKTASSRHMWNVVRMDDGLNYLVDVTGCDSAGDDRYFMKGAKGSVADGYTCSGRPYYYLASSVSAYGGGEELVLSPNCYKDAHVIVTEGYKEPTCTENGHTAGEICKICEQTFGNVKTIPAKGHVEVVLPAKEATCTENGLTEGKKCTVCGTVTVEQKVIQAAHTPVVLPAKKPTCTEPGLTEGLKCSVCGKILYEQNVIKAEGHKEDGGSITKKPTVFENGIRSYKCMVCKEVVRQEPIEKLSSAKTLKKGKTYQLKPSLVPAASTQKVTYKSYNTSVATVSSKGLITAKKAGTAKIAVVSGSIRKVVKVTVK